MDIITISLKGGKVCVSEMTHTGAVRNVNRHSGERGCASVHVLVGADGYVSKVLHGMQGGELPAADVDKVNWDDIANAAHVGGYEAALQTIGLGGCKHKPGRRAH